MHLSPQLLLVASFAGYIGAAALGLLAQARASLASALSFGVGALASLLGIWAAATVLISGASTESLALLQHAVPFITLSVRMDALSAFFLLIVSILGFSLSLYSLGYAKGFFGRKNVGVLGALFNTLLLSTAVVFVADNIWPFLIAWELMALSAFCLVSFEHEQPETRKAGVLYFVMSHIDAGCILLGFLFLFQASGDFGFGSLHGVAARMSASSRNAAFVFFLLGFGIKAGIVPLHIWLPVAHPVAPSNVSALMSGVIIKSGIYGLTRVLFQFLDNGPLWWGVVILVIGTTSAVLGVLYALMEHDLKRLLAYHSIENIGIILIGLGAALMFSQSGHGALAALALLAGMYHTFNHALFKGLLFLGAGSILHAAKTRNMEELGGLAKRMPQTAFFFLIGAVAISALPPLNGFISEWLTYQALLLGFGATSSLIRLIFPLSGAMLALTGALAAACFVKAFGITFLAQPRSNQAREAHEAAGSMRLAMGLLTLACVVVGLFPGSFMRLFLDPLTSQLTGMQLSAQLSIASGLALSSLGRSPGTISTLGLLCLGLGLLPLAIFVRFVLGRKSTTRLGPTWACGQAVLTPQMEYTATGFSKPIRMIFRALFKPRRDVQREYDFSPYFARTIRFDSHIEEIFVERFYRPLRIFILRISRRVRALQAGSIHAYLLYIFLTLILLLLFAS